MIHRYNGRHAVARAIKRLSAGARIGIGIGTLAVLSMAVLMLASTTALAAVTFDPSAGTGFVGKGDVQIALGWNNAQLQRNAGSVQFQVLKTTITTSDWSCTNTNNEHQQFRNQTTTTSTQQVTGSVARDNRNGQVTGFNLTGYTGSPTVTGTSTEGPALQSCPNAAGSWVYDNNLTQTSSGSGSLQVSNAGANWVGIYSFTF